MEIEQKNKTHDVVKIRVDSWDNPDESISSEDNRAENRIQRRYGTGMTSTAVSFSMSKDFLKEILKIMEENKIDSIWGNHGIAKFDGFIREEVKSEYFKLVGNKKLFLLEKKLEEQ